MPIIKIVSGGQTGADSGGIEAAIHCNLPHGGWCPKGRLAEDGKIPAKYLLQETPSSDYLARTEANVTDSDATLIFSYGPLEGGSLRTMEFSQKHKKPWLYVDLERDGAIKAIMEWLKAKFPKQCVLNVAGSRESKAPGIQDKVQAIMVDVLIKISP